MLSIFLLIIGFVFLIKGADSLVSGAASITRRFHVSDLVIGLTVVAFGTSLPELATSAVAAFRKNVEIAVGNVVGSNIFNIFFVLGISATVKPLPFQPKSNVDIGVVILASLLLFVSMFTGIRRKVDRWEGAIFIALYACYMLFLIFQG
jgi:cation:H+ antiporter